MAKRVEAIKIKKNLTYKKARDYVINEKENNVRLVQTPNNEQQQVSYRDMVISGQTRQSRVNSAAPALTKPKVTSNATTQTESVQNGENEYCNSDFLGKLQLLLTLLFQNDIARDCLLYTSDAADE